MTDHRHIVYWSLDEAAPEWDGLSGIEFLSANERERLEGFRFLKRRQEWLHGRLTAKRLLINCLSNCDGTTPSDISIENEPEGAPLALYQGQRLDVSLTISHRDRLALCGVTIGGGWSLGADVEKIESRQPVFIGDYFTAKEQQIVEETAGANRDQTITLIWSAKEAALKALKKGLRLDTRSVEIQKISVGQGGWENFTIASGENSRTIWRGWWQTKGEYILTLAMCNPTGEVDPDPEIQLISMSGPGSA